MNTKQCHEGKINSLSYENAWRHAVHLETSKQTNRQDLQEAINKLCKIFFSERQQNLSPVSQKTDLCLTSRDSSNPEK